MHTPSDNKRTARCCACREFIYSGATRCNHCNSYQDWRKYFDFSAVILSLLIALISVVSAVGPQIQALMPPWGSELQIKDYFYTTDGLSLIVENRGNRPGYVGNVNALLYCRGVFFTHDSIPKNLSSKLTPVWGLNINLGNVPKNNRTVPPRSTSEINFTFSTVTIEEMKSRWPEDLLGPFEGRLYNEDIMIRMSAELCDYGNGKHRTVLVTHPEEPFWQGYLTIRQKP